MAETVSFWRAGKLNLSFIFPKKLLENVPHQNKEVHTDRDGDSKNREWDQINSKNDG